MNHRKISRKELKAALSEDLDRLLDEVTQAMNSAQPGRIIADSEELVRDANAAFRERLYQKAMDLLQKKQEAFSPSSEKDRTVEK
jgi:hypothetical protein